MEKRCPLLEQNAEGIQDHKMKIYLTTMDKFSCLEDNCHLYKECWGEN